MDNLISEISEINECLRNHLYTFERISNQVRGLKVKSKVQGMLKDRLDEYCKTVTADLFIVSDFLFEAESCIDESDLEFLLEVSDENITGV